MTQTNTPQDGGDELSTYDLAVWILDFEFQDPRNRHLSRRELADIYVTHIERLVEARERLAERRGEVSQLKMLQNWMLLHDLTATTDDIDHILKSLEQFPNQPLARENLAALAKPQAGDGEGLR